MTTSRNRYECDQTASSLPGRPWHLLVLSARSAASLEAATRNLSDHLRRNPDLDIADVAFTLQAGRRLFEHRRILVCRNLFEAIEALESSDGQRIQTFPPTSKKPGLAFVFPGESPAVNTALELYETEPVFAREIGYLIEELKPQLGFDLRRLLFPREQTPESTKAMPGDAGATAAALFAIEYALAKLWESWGVSPAAVMGYGTGEYASACIAGLIEPREAAGLAVARGRVLGGEIEQTVFAKLAKGIRLHPPRLRCVSSVTGTWMPKTQPADAGYWSRQLQWTSAVEAGIRTLTMDGIGVLVQVGPGELPPREQQGPGEETPPCLRSLSAGQVQGSDLRSLVETLGGLYAAGVPVDWSAFHTGRGPRRTPLPSYAFEPRRHWFARSSRAESEPASEHAIGGLDSGNVGGQSDLSLRSRPDFGDRYVPPGNEVEETLVGLCQTLLGIDGIGIHDNIVALGADSFFTMQLSEEVTKLFGVAISPHHLFAEPNLASLAGKIRQLGPRHVRPRGAADATPKVQAPDRGRAEEYERILTFVEGLSEAQVDEALRRLAD